MTDEEKAEEYINKNPRAKILCPFEEGRIRQVKEALLYGLAEGRKENADYCNHLETENAELKAQIERMKKSCLDVMNVQGNNLSDNYMAGMYNGMVVIYNSCFLDIAKELEKNYCSKNKNDKWELAE